jgi:hypothetical protein
MKKRFVMLAAIITLVLPAASCLRDSTAIASSDFSATGSFSVSSYDSATCSVFTGPRTISEGGASLPPNEFLLRIDSDGLALELQGNFAIDKSGVLKLSPNKALAQNSFETILHSQSGDPNIGLRLQELQARVTILPVASGQTHALCNVLLTGHVTEKAPGTVPTGNPADPAQDLSFTIRNPVTLHFKGTGTY